MSGRRPGALDWLADIEGVARGEGGGSPAEFEAYDGVVRDVLRLR